MKAIRFITLIYYTFFILSGLNALHETGKYHSYRENQNEHFEIYLEYLNPGSYLLRVSDKTGETIMQEIITRIRNE